MHAGAQGGGPVRQDGDVRSSGIQRLISGISARTRSTVSMTFRIGTFGDGEQDGRLTVEHRHGARVACPTIDLSHIGQATDASVHALSTISCSPRAFVARRSTSIAIACFAPSIRPAATTHWPPRWPRATSSNPQPHGESSWDRLARGRRLLGARCGDFPTPSDLGQALHDDGVRGVVHLARRNCLRFRARIRIGDAAGLDFRNVGSEGISAGRSAPPR